MAKKSASKKAAQKKVAKKTAANKKAAAKKKVSKKVVKKTAANKAAANKAAVKKAAVKKAAVKKAAVKKKPAKKKATPTIATKQAAPPQAASKKTASKKTASKKAAAKKTAAKKSAQSGEAKPSTAEKTSKKKSSKKTSKKTSKNTGKALADRFAGSVGHTISQSAAPKTNPGTTKKRKRAVITTKPATKLSYAARLAQEAADAEALKAEPPTLAQLKKKKNGLSKKQMAFLKQELLERRAEILGDIESLGADATGNSGSLSNMPLHMADVGTDNYDREFTLGLMESERKILIEIDEALVRIKEGYYGVCMETGDPIGFARLEFKPWAKYCIDVARERERKGLQ